MGALCGFVAVDLSTDRYMPDRFGPLFEITAVSPDGADFSFMAKTYRISPAPLRAALTHLEKYRGLLPQAPRIFSALTAEAAGQLYAAAGSIRWQWRLPGVGSP